MCHRENITELGKLWQEEIINLSDTQPDNLDALENRIQDIMQRLGKAMMEWRLLRGYPRGPKSKRMEYITAFRRMLKM